MKVSAIPVTDHAVIRYLERVQGVDVEAIRHEIRQKVALLVTFPDASAINSDGWRYLIEGGSVVTMVRAHEPDVRTGGMRGERPDD